jgi:hypothetical protein
MKLEPDSTRDQVEKYMADLAKAGYENQGHLWRRSGTETWMPFPNAVAEMLDIKTLEPVDPEKFMGKVGEHECMGRLNADGTLTKIPVSVTDTVTMFALRERGKNVPDFSTVTYFADTLKETDLVEIVKVKINL